MREPRRKDGNRLRRIARATLPGVETLTCADVSGHVVRDGDTAGLTNKAAPLWCCLWCASDGIACARVGEDRGTAVRRHAAAVTDAGTRARISDPRLAQPHGIA